MAVEKSLAVLSGSSTVMSSQAGLRWGVSVRPAVGNLPVERSFTIGSPGSTEGLAGCRIVLSCTEATLDDLIAGRLNPQSAFLAGVVTLSGDLRMASLVTMVFEKALLKDPA